VVGEGVTNRCSRAEMLESLQGKSESYSTQAGWRARRVKWCSWTVETRHLRMRSALRRGMVAIFGAGEGRRRAKVNERRGEWADRSKPDELTRR
jgi:hypothetical protein